jgi:hypothetical protein
MLHISNATTLEKRHTKTIITSQNHYNITTIPTGLEPKEFPFFEHVQQRLALAKTLYEPLTHCINRLCQQRYATILNMFTKLANKLERYLQTTFW